MVPAPVYYRPRVVVPAPVYYRPRVMFPASPNADPDKTITVVSIPTRAKPPDKAPAKPEGK